MLCNFSGIDVDLSSHLGAGIGFRKTSAFVIASSTLRDTRQITTHEKQFCADMICCDK
jgi:hypothetical protein